MTLSEEDAVLFYELWLPLLDYVNKRYCVSKRFSRMLKMNRVDTQVVKEIANRLWDNVDVIDDYLTEQTDMPEEYKEIVSSWKRMIRGRFVLERHLGKGSIFVSMQSDDVYQVCGIVSSWQEMFDGAPLPIIMEAVLIPFRDVIITDGLVVPYFVQIGKGLIEEIKTVYKEARKDGRIHTIL